MILRTRFRRFLNTMLLYGLAAAAIGYFGYHAQHGQRGLNAKKKMAQEMADLQAELTSLTDERIALKRKVALMSADAIDPDLLDQRAREVLNYTHPRDIIVQVKPAS